MECNNIKCKYFKIGKQRFLNCTWGYNGCKYPYCKLKNNFKNKQKNR